MKPKSIEDLTPGALAALHDVDPEIATKFVKKYLGQVIDDPLAMQNLNASGLLGIPGQAWCTEIRSRADGLITFAVGDAKFERGSKAEALITTWLDAARPLPEDMSYLLFLGDDDNVALKDCLMDAGADPHLPILRKVNYKDSTNKESYASHLMGITDGVPAHLKKLLSSPVDDLPLALVPVVEGKVTDTPRTLLDAGLIAEETRAVQAMLDARDIHSPTVAQRMSTSLDNAIAGQWNWWALRLIGVGAEPTGGNWEPMVSFFSGHRSGTEMPRIMDNFLIEASDDRGMKFNGRPLISLALERLAAHGLDVNLVDGEGRCMLHFAAHYACLDTLQTLLTLGADYRGVLDPYEADPARSGNEEASDKGRRVLLAQAARDAMSSVVQQAKANLR